jgi:hypothetical protein
MSWFEIALLHKSIDAADSGTNLLLYAASIICLQALPIRCKACCSVKIVTIAELHQL